MSDKDTTVWLWKGTRPDAGGLSALSDEEIEALLDWTDGDTSAEDCGSSCQVCTARDKLRAELARRRGDSK